ncbi:hypothetical protein GW17_00021615 [Ensete ventricosum]|nr:hypothetical protein GW17_00021615 [Ensete ventricosum]
MARPSAGVAGHAGTVACCMAPAGAASPQGAATSTGSGIGRRGDRPFVRRLPVDNGSRRHNEGEGRWLGRPLEKRMILPLRI